MKSLQQLLTLTIVLTLVFKTFQVAGELRPLYRCLVFGWEHMVSLDVGCEGHRAVALMGYLYKNPNELAKIPIYRCLHGIDHFTSIHPNCEGHRVEGLMGYVSETDPRQQGLSAVPLYHCVTIFGNNHFVAHTINCEGQRTLSLHGYIALSPWSLSPLPS